MAQCNEIITYLDSYLNTAHIQDVSANGLQVQGCAEVETIGLAVDACMAVYEQAVARRCQMVLVHHGIIWGGLRSISGSVHRQLKYLFANDLNVYASHLPLDMHEEVGNNAVLARLLGLREIAPFGRYKGVAIGCAGTLSRPLTVRGMSMILKNALGGECITLPFGEAKIQRVGIVSGGAGDCLQEAIERGLDCFITGEPYHPNHHAAVEAGINVIYCGHYHSETVGVKALGPLLEARFGVRTLFLDEPTLV